MTSTHRILPHPFKPLKSFLSYAVGEEVLKVRDGAIMPSEGVIGVRKGCVTAASGALSMGTRHALHIAKRGRKKRVEWSNEGRRFLLRIAENIFGGRGEVGRDGQRAKLIGKGDEVLFTRQSQKIRMNHKFLIRPQIWSWAGLFAVQYYSRRTFVGAVITGYQKPRGELDLSQRCAADVFNANADPAKKLPVILGLRDSNEFGTLNREIPPNLRFLSGYSLRSGFCGHASRGCRYLCLPNALYRSIRTATRFIQCLRNQPKTGCSDKTGAARDHNHIPRCAGHTPLSGKIECFNCACASRLNPNAPRHAWEQCDQDHAGQNACAPVEQGHSAISYQAVSLRFRHATPTESEPAVGDHHSTSVNGAAA